MRIQKRGKAHISNYQIIFSRHQEFWRSTLIEWQEAYVVGTTQIQHKSEMLNSGKLGGGGRNWKYALYLAGKHVFGISASDWLESKTVRLLGPDWLKSLKSWGDLGSVMG